ncbi:hypothetical protein E5Q11_15380 [Marinobacter confluentis]|uniref:Type II secretion system protein n=1 Tax=Marinobacter confluentis TaxID=1697557 RepID=A0A4Z1BVG6_9GAMM|nr:hypothetical protein E5Q11_15380 [Marinobacter confluentis]
MSDASSISNARWLRNSVAVLLLLIFLWFLLDALERELQRAEQQAVNTVLSQLRSALVIKGAEVMLDRRSSLESQEGINPFELMDHQWGRYSGPCTGAKPEPGNWCFRERSQKETVKPGRGWLIYNPRQPISAQNHTVDAAEPLAWRVTTEFADRNGNGEREQDERSTGLKLVPVPLTEESADAQSPSR